MYLDLVLVLCPQLPLQFSVHLGQRAAPPIALVATPAALNQSNCLVQRQRVLTNNKRQCREGEGTLPHPVVLLPVPFTASSTVPACASIKAIVSRLMSASMRSASASDRAFRSCVLSHGGAHHRRRQRQHTGARVGGPPFLTVSLSSIN